MNFADCKTRVFEGENVDLVKVVDLIEKKERKKSCIFSGSGDSTFSIGEG